MTAKHAPSPTKQVLIAENAELCARLEEAEEMLRAIRRGEVDALVVESSEGPQVFTLQGVDAQSNRFRGEILAQVSDAIIAVDAEQRVTYLNAVAERQYGVVAATSLGRRLAELYEYRWLNPGDEAAAAAELRERGEWRGENLHVKPNGELLHVESSVSLLRLGNGADGGQLAVIREISERKQAEERLRVSEERFRLMANHAPVIMWETDADGGVDFVNREYCRFYGVTIAQVQGPTWQSLVHPDDRAYVEAFLDSVRGRTAFRGEARLRRADGEWRWMASYGSPRFSLSGGFLGAIGTSLDVTDQKEATEIQREGARQKDEFIAVLAHELRNPLAPIRTSVGILRTLGGADPVLVRCRDVIDRQAAHMARLLEDLLDISRLSRNALTLQQAPCLLSEVLQAAIEINEPLGHELILEGLERPIMLEADAARLTQVFGNLLNNALKYSDPGSRVYLSVRHEAACAVVTVRDAGIGIPADMLDRVFDLFTQADSARDHSPGGLGIGLSLAHRLVEMHGGTIRVTSAGPARGSEFTVRLPALEGDFDVTERLRADRPSETVPLPRRVLVVDDNVDGADSLAMLLVALKCEVRTAYDGEMAIREAERFQPEVLLLDIGMPGIDGYETCHRIRNQAWGSTMTLIALTGWGQEEDRRRSAEAGFDFHLVKPVDPATLERFLRETPPRVARQSPGR